MPCALCGAPSGSAVRAKDAFGPGFTDHDKLDRPSSEHVCVPCVWAIGSKPPYSFRLWAVLWREDWTAPPGNEKAAYPHGPRTLCTSKADMAPVIDTLLNPPSCMWVLSVPDSGQIHTLPFARVNNGAGPWTIRYEREDVSATPAQFAEVIYHATSLLCLGFIREDVFTLAPHPSKLVKHGIAAWREHAEPLRKWRRSALLGLAVNITKRDDYEAIKRQADDSRARPSARNDELCNNGQHQTAGLVAPCAVGTASGGESSNDMGPSGRHHVKEVANPNTSGRSVQISLFDGLDW